MAGDRMRGRAAVAALVVGAAVAGVWVRPHLAALNAGWHAPAGPPQPLSPALWSAKVDQFRAAGTAGAHSDVLLVYLGDSITDWTNLDEFVGGDGVRVLNRGISGDTVDGVMRRALDSVPHGTRAVFLMVGYNDLAQGETAEATAARVLDVAATLRQSGRVGVVIVESVPPPGNAVAHRVAALNGGLRAGATGRAGVSFLDLTPSFMRDGQRDAELFAAGVHLSAAGVLRRLRADKAHLAAIDPGAGGRISVAGDE
jgi:lysophospholipase L1-like esterase